MLLKKLEFIRMRDNKFVYMGELKQSNFHRVTPDGKAKFKIPKDPRLPERLHEKIIDNLLFQFESDTEIDLEIKKEYNPKTILEFIKDEEYLYAIIFGEGDNWSPKTLPINPDDLESYLKSPNNIYKGETLIQYKGSLGNNIVMICKSIMFPDGRIWDGSKGKFRNESKTINF